MSESAHNFTESQSICENMVINAGFAKSRLIQFDDKDFWTKFRLKYPSHEYWTGLLNPNGTNCAGTNCAGKLTYLDGQNFEANDWMTSDNVRTNGNEVCMRVRKYNEQLDFFGDDTTCQLVTKYACEVDCSIF